jgi:hypothetical protein
MYFGRNKFTKFSEGTAISSLGSNDFSMMDTQGLLL